MLVLRVMARLLEYPTAELQAAGDELCDIVEAETRLRRSQKRGLTDCIRILSDGDVLEHQENYVGLFERGRSLSLLLFEHVHGESRDRGQAMVDLMGHYQSAGLELDAKELPDHLPLFLEFLSTREWSEIRNWLEDIHHILGLLAERLHQRDSIYQSIFQALVALAGQKPDRRELASIVASEKRDDTPEALDSVWEEEMVKFMDDQGKSCSSGSLVGQRRQELDKVQPVHLSDDLMQDALKNRA
ncbi:nitrate reductase molybdenum cofactor assembly chaperone [Marinobacter sp. 1Y8]